MRERWLDEAASAVQDHQDEQRDVQVVRDPESAERITPRVLHRKHVHQEDDDGQDDASKP